eukprot:TRINITY_DN2512_c0_g2_i4.p1 TRINITY_DN2512_c0_g2~~TRINITY_DN2512_c0_g2_i4.p1  ORF type:complete len:282 (+),score=46.64 TRINITY_DN2512_c0_g2_i4:521-1366(+)
MTDELILWSTHQGISCLRWAGSLEASTEILWSYGGTGLSIIACDEHHLYVLLLQANDEQIRIDMKTGQIMERSPHICPTSMRHMESYLSKHYLLHCNNSILMVQNLETGEIAWQAVLPSDRRCASGGRIALVRKSWLYVHSMIDGSEIARRPFRGEDVKCMKMDAFKIICLSRRLLYVYDAQNLSFIRASFVPSGCKIVRDRWDRITLSYESRYEVDLVQLDFSHGEEEIDSNPPSDRMPTNLPLPIEPSSDRSGIETVPTRQTNRSRSRKRRPKINQISS